MNKAEIMQYVQFGGNGRLIIDRRILPEYCGYVREIAIAEGNVAVIEFNSYGYDEGGITYFIEFAGMDELISGMQEYLRLDISLWENINKTGYYPDKTKECGFPARERLIGDFVGGLIALPKNSTCVRIADGYWKDMIENKKKGALS